jgi:hypothetical protein
VKIIKHDLNVIAKADSSPKSQKVKYLNMLKFLHMLKFDVHWLSIKNGKPTLIYYKPLGKLFELLAEYKLAAYFYQVSCGEVPQNILSKMSLDPQTYKYHYSGIIVYGMDITRKKTDIELMSVQIVDFMSYIKQGIIHWSGQILNVLKSLILGIIAITITIIQWIFQGLLFLFYASICLLCFAFALQNFGVFFILLVIYLIAAGSNNN